MTIDFSLSPEQEDVRRLAHEFAEREIRPVAAHYDEAEEFPHEIVQKAHRIGLTSGAFIPQQYGGHGLDQIASLVVIEELHWGCAGIAVSIQSSRLAIAAISTMGDDEQRRRWLPEFCRPERLQIGALCLTEPDAGSDMLALRTTAERTVVRGGPGYVINGTKQFCTNGGIADHNVVVANTDPAIGPAGIAAFVVDGAAPGLSMGRKERKLGVRASHTAQVILQDCFVPQEHRLGGEREGAAGVLRTLETTRPGVAAGAIGVARAAHEFALDYAGTRRQFGRPLIQHQAIAFKLADMATRIDAARLLVWRAGWMLASGRAFERAEGSMAKLLAGDVAMGVTVDAVQVLGGYGYVRDNPVEKWMRDAKIFQIWEGTAEMQRLVIARALTGRRTSSATPLDLPRQEVWSARSRRQSHASSRHRDHR